MAHRRTKRQKESWTEGKRKHISSPSFIPVNGKKTFSLEEGARFLLCPVLLWLLMRFLAHRGNRSELKRRLSYHRKNNPTSGIILKFNTCGLDTCALINQTLTQIRAVCSLEHSRRRQSSKR